MSYSEIAVLVLGVLLLGGPMQGRPHNQHEYDRYLARLEAETRSGDAFRY